MLVAPLGRFIIPSSQWNDVQRLLTFVYVQATKIAHENDKVLMEIDVLLRGTGEALPEEIGQGIDMVYRVQGDSITAPLPMSIFHIQQNYMPAASASTSDSSTPPSTQRTDDSRSIYPVVALGGTFDHLHAGHKILLNAALLKNKSNSQVLEPLEIRLDRVRSFLNLFKAGLELEIVPISDVYGPTGWDPNIQALVVSKETLSGAKSIAEHRAKKSLPQLQTFVIDVISSTSACLDAEDVDMLKQIKMSSTYIREWIVQRNQV
ncbi:hypothetical protein C8J56DRAFT_1167953 [Mycena floridula]|nr:hypothetical protein C8J56DRAFT_1167953 [Mycena floridula]